MSLSPCADCGRQVSSKAERCPNCGRKTPGASDSEDSVPFLVSVAEVRRRKVKCRECGQEVSLGAGSCPGCGFAHPGDTPVRWWLLITVGLMMAALGTATAWQLGLVKSRAAVSSAAADSAAIKANVPSVSYHRRRDPPRIRSARYPAACLSPAPVLVYALDRTPATFFVRLAGGISNPVVVTESLVTRHKLQSHGYEPPWNALYIKDATPAVVSALRCETAVNSIEEVAYNDLPDLR